MGASFALGSLVHPASEAIKQLARLGGHIDGDLLAIHIQAELLGVLARDLVQRAYRPGTREVLGSRGGAGMCTVRGGGVGAGDGERLATVGVLVSANAGAPRIRVLKARRRRLEVWAGFGESLARLHVDDHLCNSFHASTSEAHKLPSSKRVAAVSRANSTPTWSSQISFVLAT